MFNKNSRMLIVLINRYFNFRTKVHHALDNICQSPIIISADDKITHYSLKKTAGPKRSCCFALD